MQTREMAGGAQKKGRRFCLRPYCPSGRKLSLLQVDLGAAVLRFFHAVGGLNQEFAFAFTRSVDRARRDAFADEVRLGGVGTAYGEFLVVFGRARGVGVTDDRDRRRARLSWRRRLPGPTHRRPRR